MNTVSILAVVCKIGTLEANHLHERRPAARLQIFIAFFATVKIENCQKLVSLRSIDQRSSVCFSKILRMCCLNESGSSRVARVGAAVRLISLSPVGTRHRLLVHSPDLGTFPEALSREPKGKTASRAY